MNTQSDQLNEARELLEALEGRRMRNAGDQRFIESWRCYLDRTKDAAQLGRWRMTVLKRVAATYGIGADEGETNEL